MAKEIPQMRSLKPRQLLYQIAQEEIKAYIIKHGLKPGDALPPETDLSHQLNISRNSVREAVKSLEAVGILEARSGSGLFVRDFTFEPILNNLPYGILSSLKHLTDILEIRALLESGMADRVLASMTGDQIDYFRQVLVRMHSAAERGDYSAEDDREFHQLLYRNIDNPLLSQIVDIFWVVFRQAQQHAAIPGPLNPMETYRCHVDIVDALEKQDLDALHAAMARHFDGITRRIQLAQQTRNEQSRLESPVSGHGAASRAERVAHIRQKLRKGQSTIGCFLKVGSPDLTELLVHNGFDWLVVETEPELQDLPEMQQVLLQINASETIPLVRVPSSDRGHIQRALEMGALGIVVPSVRSVSEVESIVAVTQNPQYATGSVDLLPARPTGNQKSAHLDATLDVTGTPLVVLQIDTPEAIANLEAIAFVPGVDVLYIGTPMVGRSANTRKAALEATINAALAFGHQSGVAIGTYCDTADQLRHRQAQRLLFFGSNPGVAVVVSDGQPA